MPVGGIKQYISISVYKMAHTLDAWAGVFSQYVQINELIHSVPVMCQAPGKLKDK